jgi:hypothetical protein
MLQIDKKVLAGQIEQGLSRVAMNLAEALVESLESELGRLKGNIRIVKQLLQTPKKGGQ